MGGLFRWNVILAMAYHISTQYNTQNSLQTCFSDPLNLCKILPSFQLLSRNLANTLQVLINDNFASVCRSDGFEPVRKTTNQGRGLLRVCCVKNSCVGEGWELERALDDAFGI